MFTTDTGHYEYLRMPFRLCNGSSRFQKNVEIVLKPLIGKCVMVYIDDVIVYSKSVADHVDPWRPGKEDEGKDHEDK